MTDDQILDVIANQLSQTACWSNQDRAEHILAALRAAGYDVVRVEPEAIDDANVREHTEQQRNQG